jgi:adenylosuccinate synthase
VVVGEKSFKFHLLPSGIIHAQVMNVIGNGTVINPAALVDEIKNLQSQGFEVSPTNLAISSAAHVISENHLAEDNPKESLHSQKIGTTGRGIGPCYRDKMVRSGMRMETFVSQTNSHAQFLKPFVQNTALMIKDAFDRHCKILYEGAQGTLLDIDHGTYPFVTSSNSTIGGILTGSGVGLSGIESVLGIFKAYSTRVGRGPFVTELGNEAQLEKEGRWEDLRPSRDAALKEATAKANEGNGVYAGKLLRLQGVEYGTTTGRPRRCGWFDMVAAKYAVMINSLDSFALTKLDVLQNLTEIKVCTEYQIDKSFTSDFPANTDLLDRTKPKYISFPGWKEDLSSVRAFEHLPDAARKYVRALQDLLGIPCALLSVGPEREQTLIMDQKFLL